MLRIALIYGGIASAVVVGAITAGIAMSPDGHGGGQTVGFAIMFLAFALIFFGVKRHRDQDRGGVIKFLPALGLGLAVAAVATVVYVVVWEVYLAATDYAFIHQYAEGVIESQRAKGLSGEALEREIAKVEAVVRNYDNPFLRLPITASEIFPVGAVVALISAALLRNEKFLPARA